MGSRVIPSRCEADIAQIPCSAERAEKGNRRREAGIYQGVFRFSQGGEVVFADQEGGIGMESRNG